MADIPRQRTGADSHHELRAAAITLRRAGLSRDQIRTRLQVRNNDHLNRLLAGEPPPEWTKRPNAKDDLRARARELRREGRTYDEIAAELGVAKSSVSLWVRDLPKPQKTPEQMHAMREARWGPYRAERDRAQRRTRQAASREIGTLTDRELFLIGVGLYWAEGSKSKPYRLREQVAFINSDPDMIEVYLAWLALLEVGSARLRFNVMIHESADVAGAERYWADLVGRDVADFGKTTLKKHNPKTVRKNVGADYCGCLVVRVLQGADLYRRIEGWWSGIVCGARDTLRGSNRT
jgi:transposase